MKPVSERRNYKNPINAIARIAKEEGFSALYKGYRPIAIHRLLRV
jgi:hypothetical protein